jgi:hypothetical protein
MAIQTFSSGQTLTAAQMNSLQANDYNQTVSAKTTSYTLVAGDVGTHVQMTASTATTISVPAATFAAGDTLFLSSQGAGACTIQAASTAITVNGTNLVLAQYGGGTLRFQSASAATFFSGGAPVWGTATGGIGAPTSVTISGVNYQYLTFNSTGTLTVTRAGFFDYLAIGGGTGNAYFNDPAVGGGGGGAGQVVFGSVYLSANQTITIGAGSAGIQTTTKFNQASPTTIAATSPFQQNALGGLYGIDLAKQSSAYVGGGAGGNQNGVSFAVTESLALGYRGGAATANGGGGGGGGQSGRGGDGGATSGGVGGTGVDISSFVGGSASYRATGGGGGGSASGGAGGNSSASSNAGSTTSTANSAAANSGSGGGSGYGSSTITGGAGGSGVCFIRWVV